MTVNDAYAALEQRFRRLDNLLNAEAILHWDQQTMMPAGAAESRAEQLATLKVLCHEMIVEPAMADLIAAAKTRDGLTAWQRANLRE
ncbi:MAG: carboxypeptidase M32, partial [Alphaproteobacteria bacterium]|nr:carboxypeptidase M32 [Alphaproteobacteria bacterium]